ncbi:hypothetical protein BU26DRAFT_296769 [Trematosphaeria pertusa]|uniref:Rhodopsin domain-containing protein n=1 Tax=Trematosphaeria pertusa TaxID=390896 RepID=A0A6A6IJV5_9PLEO|nr:uncharacterized protein BU26DRAFT_296769 [Trematosphaeria pertusa]KAF2250162.1 hypothetical protein BU26DRAFT_296769 [Trematosphaeria pertusa]
MASAVDDNSSGPALVGTGIFLQILTACLVAARITTRLSSGKPLQWHDRAILLAELLSLPQLIFVINATSYGFGSHQQVVSLPNRTAAQRSIFIAQVIWYFSTTLAKVSVVCLLLSLKRTSRAWIIFSYIAISILLCALIPITLTQFLACRPFSVYWDPAVRFQAVCWTRRAIAANVIAFSVIQALSDVVLSLIPLTFLLKLNLPLRERIVISILMGLGLLASATAIARTVIGVKPGPDMFRTDADITLLALIDLHVGIIAATLPTLKAFFEGCLVSIINWSREERTEEEVRATLCKLGLLDQGYDPKTIGIQVRETGKSSGG